VIAFRIKCINLFNLITKEYDPDCHIGICRKHIYCITPHPECPVPELQLIPGVKAVYQFSQKLVASLFLSLYDMNCI